MAHCKIVVSPIVEIIFFTLVCPRGWHFWAESCRMGVNFTIHYVDGTGQKSTGAGAMRIITIDQFIYVVLIWINTVFTGKKWDVTGVRVEVHL